MPEKIVDRPINLGLASRLTFSNNVFGIALINTLRSVDFEKRAKYLVDFIFNGKAHLLLESLLGGTDDDLFAFPENFQKLELGEITKENIGSELYKKVVHLIGDAEEKDISTIVLSAALDPANHCKETKNIEFDLLDSQVSEIGETLLNTPLKERPFLVISAMKDAYDNAITDKPSLSRRKMLNFDITLEIINPVGKKKVRICDKISQKQIDDTVSFLNSLPVYQQRIFIARALIRHLEEGRGLVHRMKHNLPYLFVSAEPKGFPILVDGQVKNQSIDYLRFEYELTNNRVKDRIGASDSSMREIKKYPQQMVNDPVIGMIVRAFNKFPELLSRTLPKKVDIPGIIEHLGGSDRSFGVYLGRNPFTAHRYLNKSQSPPQHVAALLEIFATFLQQGQLQDYIEHILLPEAHARGVHDIFSAEGWPKGSHDDKDD